MKCQIDPWHMNANTAFIGVTEPWDIYVNHDTAFYMSRSLFKYHSRQLEYAYKKYPRCLIPIFSECQFMLIAH